MGVTKRDFQVVYIYVDVISKHAWTFWAYKRLGGIRGCSYRISSWHWVDSIVTLIVM